MGQRPKKMNSRTNSQNASPRSARISGTLFRCSLWNIFSYFSFVIFKMLFLIFWPLPDKLLDCPKKLFCPTLGGEELQPPSPAPQLIMPMTLITPGHLSSCRVDDTFGHTLTPVNSHRTLHRQSDVFQIRSDNVLPVSSRSRVFIM